MSDEIGTYSFLPWLRNGIANSITSDDLDQSVKLRATFPVDLQLTGRAVEDEPDLVEQVQQHIALYGPGDITGIDQRVIIRTEPRPGTTDFEPNYLVHIDFAEEDFPWRYTPARPDTPLNRLRPWLALVVLKETEFEDAANPGTRPLPAINVTAPRQTAFPPARQLWAWAHVHINRDIIKDGDTIVADDMNAALDNFEDILGKNRDHAYSRIICPRRLEPETPYHVFLVPSFESGRLSGLGLEQPVENAEFFATRSAWSDYTDRTQPTIYPFYHRWYFKTGEKGDFEYLVRLIKPRPPDSRLGRLDMDVQAPGSNISGIARPELQGMLRLGGALQVPEEALTPGEIAEAEDFEEWDDPYPQPFQRELSAFINLAQDYAETTPEVANTNAELPAEVQGQDDPLITPPLYGQWHALTDRLLFDTDGGNLPQNRNWVHELNLDPRFRVPAGFGTRVIQKNQEAYMDAAWEQVGDIIEANRQIRHALLAREVSTAWYARQLTPLNERAPARGLMLTAPVQKRVISDGATVYHTIGQSLVPRAALSLATRRILRPRDHIAQRLNLTGPEASGDLITKINDGTITPAPPKTVPDELPTVEDVSDDLQPKDTSPGFREWLQQNPLFMLVLVLLAIIIALLALVISPFLSLIILAAGVAAYLWLQRVDDEADAADAILPEGNAPGAIDALPKFPDFTLHPFGEGSDPQPGDNDSPEATRFKGALKDVHQVLTTSATLGFEPERPPISVASLATASFAAINPQVTVPRFTFGAVTLPPYIAAGFFFETFQEAMAYPQIDKPMYEELKANQLLPNIRVIPDDTITLMETNQRFIEAYMVGLNHEFARELLWREYPTDQRGSYFRQFWEASEVINDPSLDPDELRETLYDIPPLHLWSRFSDLGDHDHRDVGGSLENLVAVLRCKLLKRYPNAVIYMHRAKWQTNEDGTINTDAERELETEGELAELVKTPIFEARVNPDVTFLGFELTAEQAKGENPLEVDDPDPGYFAVIKEREGDMRFGLDINRDGDLNVWNDLAWPDVLDNGDNGFLQIRPGTDTLTLSDPTGDPLLVEKVEQFTEDQALRWHSDTNSAELAYILYQVPVLVAVHASEMLRS